ncbi:unnamed protein product, partial [Ectocarpus sp. 4 AP-2014]
MEKNNWQYFFFAERKYGITGSPGKKEGAGKSRKGMTMPSKSSVSRERAAGDMRGCVRERTNQYRIDLLGAEHGRTKLTMRPQQRKNRSASKQQQQQHHHHHDTYCCTFLS